MEITVLRIGDLPQDPRKELKPLARNLPNDFTRYGGDVISFGLASESEKWHSPSIVNQSGILLPDAARLLSPVEGLIESISSEFVGRAIEALKTTPSKDLRPIILQERLNDNTFHFVRALGLVGHALAAQARELMVSSGRFQSLAPFGDYIRANPQSIAPSSEFRTTYLAQERYTPDLADQITSNRKTAEGLLLEEEFNRTLFSALEERAPKPLEGMNHLSHWHRRPRSGSSGSLYFGGMSRFDLSEPILGGVEIAFKTGSELSLITMRPLYSWRKTWDIDMPNGDCYYIKISDGNGQLVPFRFANGSLVEHQQKKSE